MNDDDAGAPPKPIDVSATLGADSTDGETAHNPEPASEDEAASTFKPQAMRSGEALEGGSGALQGSFSTTETVPQHIENVRTQLGTINKFFYGRDVQKIQRAHVLKLAKELFDYQFQDMQHLLLLGMDVQKKRRFVQYLQETKDIQDKIQRQSAQAQLAMINTMFDMRLEAFRAKKERDELLVASYRKGDMDEAQYKRSLRDNETMIRAHEDRLNHTMDQLITRHSQFLYETLALFKTDLITGGKI